MRTILEIMAEFYQQALESSLCRTELNAYLQCNDMCIQIDFFILGEKLTREVIYTSALITNIFNFRVAHVDSQGNGPEKKPSVKANNNKANTNILLPLVRGRKSPFLSQKWVASLMNFYILIYIYFIVGEVGVE